MTDISVIILVGREERHIGRCLEKLAPLEPRRVFVVESQKGDRTHELAAETVRESLNWRIGELANEKVGGSVLQRQLNTPTLYFVWHDWPGNQAGQFNWALDALCAREIGKSEKRTEWFLRLDADEYLTPDTIERLKVDLPRIPEGVKGLTLELRRRFCGGEIRHGTNGIRQVRLFRHGKARYAVTMMDERLTVEGVVADFDGAFFDDSLMSMSEWQEKHRTYARREARQAVESMKSGVWTDPRKEKYYKLPPYFRALAYFGFRYLLKGGFLDGVAGCRWNFWQGMWYRLLVDREIGRMKHGRREARA